MVLSVPTTWENDYLLRLKEYPSVEWIYGNVPTEVIGSGRQVSLLPSVDRHEAADHIKQAQRLGLKFNYLVNTACLGNLEYIGDFHRAIIKYLEWVAEQSPDMVTVTIPFIGQLIKKQFPTLKLCVGKYANVDSLEKAKFWENLGADEVVIPDDGPSRDFKLLRVMRQNLRCEIQVFANLACLRGCPFANYHANLASHGSQPHEVAGGAYVDSCLVNCKNIRVKNPVEIIKSGWIRPEDLHHYEAIGINKFKLVDRSLNARGLLKRVKAYSERKHEGNLADIICLHTRRTEHRFVPGAKSMDRRARENLRQMGDAIFAAEKTFIDNQKLEGFLNGLKKIDCRYVACEKCGYCEKFAQKAVTLSESDRAEAIRRSDLFLGQLTSSELFQETEQTL